MNKLVFVFFTSFLLAHFTNAQKGSWTFGLEAGPNVSNMSKYSNNEFWSEFQEDVEGDYYQTWDRAKVYNPLSGFKVGGVVEHSTSDYLSIKSGVFYDMRRFMENGWRNSRTNPRNESMKFNTENEMGYIVVPLSLKISLGKRLAWYGEAGIYYGYAIVHRTISQTYRVKSTGDKLVGSYENPNNLNARIVRYDFGFNLGVGLRYIIIDEWSLHIEIEKSSSIYPISSIYGDLRFNSTAILFGVSYKFD